MKLPHLFSILVFTGISTLINAQDLTIIHIDVGQGDSTLILGPIVNGERISVLMDSGNITMGGSPDGGRIVGAVLQQNGITELDWFIASHYDADHIGGVITGRTSTHGSSFILGVNGVPGNIGDDDGDGTVDWLGDIQTQPDADEIGTGDDIKVLNFVDRGDSPAANSATYRKYKEIANAMGIRHTLSSRGEVNNFSIDLGGGAEMFALAANGFVKDRSSRVANVNTENERSLAFLIQFGGFDYLIGGDMIGRQAGQENAEVEKAVGEYILDENISVDVLHVGHHGADNASEESFLTAIGAETAIISLGNGNTHHHPDEDALLRLAESGVFRIYQTNWGTTRGETPEAVRRVQAIFQGDIILTTDGISYEISTSRIFDVDE